MSAQEERTAPKGFGFGASPQAGGDAGPNDTMQPSCRVKNRGARYHSHLVKFFAAEPGVGSRTVAASHRVALREKPRTRQLAPEHGEPDT